ncbi:AraC-type DNA-binding protein [Spirosomataceae bacterium TFI 002]|nr:AraC-type DNA-binding protein [Spirosomataceae bacterium TFI 002]
MKATIEKIIPDTGSSFKLIEWKSENDKFYWHQHPEYEIILVTKGSGKRQIGNHKGNYQQGEVFFLGPYLPHTGLGYGVEGKHEEIIIQLDPNFLGTQFWEIPETEVIRPIFNLAKRGLSFSGKSRKELGKLIKQIPFLSPFERLVQLLKIFQTMATSSEMTVINKQEINIEVTGKHQQRINQIYKYVADNYHLPIDLEEVAVMVNLTKPSFCRYFKKMTNHTFTKFLGEFRIQQACRLLQEDKSIAQVCYESGFNNLSHFNKTFKQLKEMSPKAYRDQMEPNY